MAGGGTKVALEEMGDVATAVLVERVQLLVVDYLEIGDVLAREALPCGRIVEHEVGVNGEQGSADQKRDDQDDHADEQVKVVIHPESPR